LNADRHGKPLMPQVLRGLHYGADLHTVEPAHTRVLFAVSHMGFTTWYGEFTQVSGNLNLSPKSVGASTLEIHIPTNTISTSNAKLDGELKSPQWLDAEKFPEIVFKARQLSAQAKLQPR
jgi:polyisoprenoid-binding protein YceI